jgi:hypothetical protein
VSRRLERDLLRSLPRHLISGKNTARAAIIYVRDENFVTEANILKASTNDNVKGKFRGSRGETNDKLRKLTNDPTLEGKDENKVGRIERKIVRTGKTIEK